MKYLTTVFFDLDSIEQPKDTFEKKAFFWLHIRLNSFILSVIFSNLVRSNINSFIFKIITFYYLYVATQVQHRNQTMHQKVEIQVIK